MKPSTPRLSTWAWPTLGGHGHQPRQVLGRDLQQVAGLGGLGDHQHVARLGRGVVHEGQHLVVLVDLGHDDLAAQDAGEAGWSRRRRLFSGTKCGRADRGRGRDRTGLHRPPQHLGLQRDAAVGEAVVGVHA